jgi:hypothetical protein
MYMETHNTQIAETARVAVELGAAAARAQRYAAQPASSSE